MWEVRQEWERLQAGPGSRGRFNAWKGSQEPSCHPFLRGPFCGSALPTEMPSFPGLSPHTSGHHPSPFTSVLIRRGICSLGRPHVPPTGFSLLPAAPAGSPGCAQPLRDEVLGCWGDPWLGQMPSYSPGMLLLEISLPGFKHSAVTTRSLSPARPLPAGCPGGISHLPGPKQRASLSALTCCSKASPSTQAQAPVWNHPLPGPSAVPAFPGPRPPCLSQQLQLPSEV